MGALRVLVSSFAILLLPTGVSAACYCACYTETGGRCTVSVPNYSCGRPGTSLCTGPLERCAYDCRQQVERPPTCSPRRRCSVRN